MRYHYIAFNQNGQQLEGEIDVADEGVVERVLWEQKLTVVKITPAQSHRSLAQLFPTFFGVKREDLLIFSRQFATLLTSGISILPALQLLVEQATKPALQEVLQNIIATVQKGGSLSTALAEHPHVFPPIYTRSIRVGEHTGNLGAVLKRLTAYFKKEQSLTRQLRDAMIYPIFVIVVAIFVVILMFTVALPPIIDLFSAFNAQLPWPTRVLIALSTFITQYGLYLLIGGLVLAAALGWWGTQPSGRKMRDRLLLRIPLVGRVALLAQVTRFTHTLAMLIRAGIPLAEAVDLTLHTITNSVISEALLRVRTALLSGRGLAAPLAAEPVFPVLISQMVRVGEETGTLEESLSTLSTFYEDEMDHKTQQMIAAVEPVLTIVIGALVGFIAIAMIMPMYSILSEIE